MKFGRFRPLVLTLILITVIVITVNIFTKTAMSGDLVQQVDYWVNLRQFPQAAALLKQEIDRDPAQLAYQHQYLELIFMMQPQNRSAYQLEEYYEQLGKQAAYEDLSYWGNGWLNLYRKKPLQALDEFSMISNRQMKYLHLGIAYANQQLKNETVAQQELITEIQNNENLRIAYSELFTSYFISNQLEKAALLINQNPDLLPDLYESDLRLYAMRQRDFVLYLKAVLLIPFGAMDPFAVFSSLFIALIWFFYFWRIDVFDQEPVLISVLALVSGIVMGMITIPVGDMLHLVNPFNLITLTKDTLFFNVVFVGLLEEFAKFLPVTFIILFMRQVNEPVDLLIYGSLTALGFATLENILMISQYGVGIMVARLLIATIMHMVSTAVICFAWAYARFINPGKLLLFSILGWFSAALVHGLFDHFVLSANRGLSALSLLILVLSVWGYSLMLRNALNFSPFFMQSQTRSGRLVNYEWILIAAFWLLAMGYLYIHVIYSTAAANRWLVTNFWTAVPMVLGLFAALGELGLKKDSFVFP